MKKEKKVIKPVDVTGQVQYEQGFMTRYIEDAEAKNPTLKGKSTINMPLMKVVDVSGLFKMARGKSVHLAYFRLDYSNVHPYKKGKRLTCHDWACSVYVNGKILAKNLRFPYYFIDEMKVMQVSRHDAETLLDDTLYFYQQAQRLVQMMIDYVPRSSEEGVQKE